MNNNLCVLCGKSFREINTRLDLTRLLAAGLRRSTPIQDHAHSRSAKTCGNECCRLSASTRP